MNDSPTPPAHSPQPSQAGNYPQAQADPAQQQAPGQYTAQQIPQPHAVPQGPPKTYHHGLRRDQGGNWWRGILALVMLAVGFVLVQLILGLVMIVQSGGLSDVMAGEQPELSITPVSLLMLNLGLAAMWPLSIGIQRLLYGVKAGPLHSVAGMFRWRLFVKLAIVLVPIYLVYTLGFSLLDPAGAGTFTATAVAFLIVALLTTPLQSAGEEVMFRGLGQRAIGGWFSNARVALVVGTVIASALFASAHGSTDWWLNAYYFIFGVSMAIITWRTQGLEGAIIAHAANNTFLFIIGAIQGMDFDGLLEREDGAGGSFMLVPMIVCLAIAGVVWWRTSNGRLRDELKLPEPITPSP